MRPQTNLLNKYRIKIKAKLIDGIMVIKFLVLRISKVSKILNKCEILFTIQNSFYNQLFMILLIMNQLYYLKMLSRSNKKQENIKLDNQKKILIFQRKL